MYKIGKQDLSSLFGFVTIGFMLGQVGPILSAASVDLGVEAGLVGRMIAFYYGISILGIALGFFLIKRIGKELFILGGSALLIVTYGFGLYVNSTNGLIVMMMFLGLGLGVYQIGINSMAVDNTSRYPRSQQSGRMSYMQFFFGIGAVVSPLLVDFSHLHLQNWRYSYLMILVLGPMVTILFVSMDLKRKRSADGMETAIFESGNALISNPIRWSWVLVLTLMLAGIYTSLETSIFNWLSYYWDHRHGEIDIVTGARATAVFWGVFSISRLMMGWVIGRLGDWTAMVTFTSIVILSLALWWFLNPAWWGLLILVVIISLMMGCMFPTIMMITSRLQPGESSQVLSLLFVWATATAAIVPVGIGIAIKQTSVSVYPMTVTVLGLFFFSMLLVTLGITRRAAGGGQLSD